MRHFRKLSAKEVENAITEVLESVGLSEAIDKMPSELSGGMRKRIGLARTLILKPEIILYDAPTTGLDTITSREISELILEIQKKYKTTFVIITHNGNGILSKVMGDETLSKSLQSTLANLQTTSKQFSNFSTAMNSGTFGFSK